MKKKKIVMPNGMNQQPKKYFIILSTKDFRKNVFSFVAIKPLVLILILS